MNIIWSHSYRWLFYINPNYYGFSASSFLLLRNFNTGCKSSSFDCYTSSGVYVLQQFGFDAVNPYLHVLVSFQCLEFKTEEQFMITLKYNSNFRYCSCRCCSSFSWLLLATGSIMQNSILKFAVSEMWSGNWTSTKIRGIASPWTLVWLKCVESRGWGDA